MRRLTDADFLTDICLPFLQAAQNKDGGWGFQSGSRSRVEPTSWALLALQGLRSSNGMRQAGVGFLRSTQLPDGSWPSSSTQKVGCWAASLASLALLSDPESRSAVAAGLNWICADWPRSSNLMNRIIRKIVSRNPLVSQNDSLRGWGWTPGTASWVEPTAFALIVLRQAPQELRPRDASRRCQLAKALIYDRMCPSGGWNCGNPMVYGVAGEPLVEPTVWALMALDNEPNGPEKRMSIEWLQQKVPEILGPGSLALARICLKTYERIWPATAPTFGDLYESNRFLDSVPAMAWTCLALQDRTNWLMAA